MMVMILVSVSGNWTGFNVLPPNASISSYGNGTGGMAEFWTTGCTLVSKDSPGYGYNSVYPGNIASVGFTGL